MTPHYTTIQAIACGLIVAWQLVELLSMKFGGFPVTRYYLIEYKKKTALSVYRRNEEHPPVCPTTRTAIQVQYRPFRQWYIRKMRAGAAVLLLAALGLLMAVLQAHTAKNGDGARPGQNNVINQKTIQK